MKSWVVALAVFSEGAGVIATAIQVYKTARTKNKRGISVWKNALIGSSILGWLVYGVSQTIWPVVVSNTLMLPLMTYFLYLLAHSKKRKQLIAIMFVCGALLGMVLLFLSKSAAGWVSLAYMTLAMTPQIVKVIRDKRIDGLSRRAEKLWFFVNIATFLYAFELRAYPLIIAGIVGTSYSIVVLGMLHRKHPRHKR